MANIDSILTEIRKLDFKELEVILQEVLDRINRKKQAKLALDSFIGKGEGIWEHDAQHYVNTMRENDRHR